MKITKLLVVIAAFLFLVFNMVRHYIKKSKSRSPIASSIPELSFTWTVNEEAELDEWENKTNAETIEAAFMGNRAALYIIGESCLNQQKEEMGLQMISESAALGFAPAVHRLIINDLGNLALYATYLELLIQLGHQEFSMAYDHLYASKDFQNAISQDEIRNIKVLVAYKKSTIIQNQQALHRALDKKEFYLNLAGITDDDAEFVERLHEMQL